MKVLQDVLDKRPSPPFSSRAELESLDTFIAQSQLLLCKLRGLSKRYANVRDALQVWASRLNSGRAAAAFAIQRHRRTPAFGPLIALMNGLSIELKQVRAQAEGLRSRSFELAREHDSVYSPNKDEYVSSKFPRASYIKKPPYTRELEARRAVLQARDYFALAVKERTRIRSEIRSFESTFNNLSSSTDLVSEVCEGV